MNGDMRRLGLGAALLLLGLLLAPSLWAGDGNNNFRLAVTDAPDDSADSNARDIVSGCDLDQDGRYEIIITDYSYGGRAHVYEIVGNDALAWVWSSPGTDSPEWAPARAVQVADLDADGRGEILLSICQNGAAPGTAGIHVFEWDAVTDNGYGATPIAVFPIDATLTGGFTEDFAVADLDDDLRPEILYLNRGSFEQNRCYVLSITGSFENSWSVNAEAFYRQDAGDLNGPPWDVAVADLDGDGFKEAIYSLRDGGGGMFIVEATGPDSYVPAITLHLDPYANGYSLEGMAAADVNSDGKDELYVALQRTGNVASSGPLILVSSGDEVAAMTFADNVRYLRDDGAGCYGLAIGDQDHGAGSDGPDIYLTSFGSESVGGFIQDFEIVGSDLLAPASYVEHVIFQDLASAWPGGFFQIDIPGVDLDGDGRREVVVSYTGETATGVYFRILEFDPNDPALTLVTPNGGESWTEGTSETIVWSSGNFIGGVDLDYTTDGGITWKSIVKYFPNHGSYNWSVPFDPADQVLVRIAAAGSGAPFDLSDDYFTIAVCVNQPPIAAAGADQTLAATSPAGAAVTLDGSGSTDPDHDPLTYTWYENGEVIAGPTSEATSQITLALGVHDLELTVDDGKGGAATDQVTITVEEGLEMFSLYANKFVEIRECDGSEGWAGSNGKLTVLTGTPSTMAIDLRALGDITIYRDNTIAGDVISNASIHLDPRSTVTGATIEHAARLPLPLPDPVFTAGGNNVVVAKKGSRSLTPGSYGNVTVGKSGKLYLRAGEYYWTSLRLGQSSEILMDLSEGSLQVNIVGSLTTGDDAVIAIAPAGSSTTRAVLFTVLDDGVVSLGNAVTFMGTLLAPQAHVKTSSELRMQGAIYADSITGLKRAVFLHHSSMQQLPKPAGVMDEKTAAWPQEFALLPNFPNPFNPETEIRFALPEASFVVLKIFNTLGEEIRILVEAPLAPGTHSVHWDGTDRHGSLVVSGVYLCRLQAGGFSQVRKMSLVR
ncbi:MAG: hypothetical protein DKINENOH_03984 [bacterium]|nr:hypothetical protein [bacterium]